MADLEPLDWRELPTDQQELDYTCAWCNRDVSSRQGATPISRAMYRQRQIVPRGALRTCPRCGRPTFFGEEGQYPGAKHGDVVGHLPDDLAGLYGEARDCISVNAYHAAVMVARKILMHVAVQKDAEGGKPFAYYVDYLVDKNLVGSASKEWIDEIREVANDANHEIFEIREEDAKGILDFTSMLLKIVYEFPERGRLSVEARKAKDEEAAEGEQSAEE